MSVQKKIRLASDEGDVSAVSAVLNETASSKPKANDGSGSGCSKEVVGAHQSVQKIHESLSKPDAPRTAVSEPG